MGDETHEDVLKCKGCVESGPWEGHGTELQGKYFRVIQNEQCNTMIQFRTQCFVFM